MWNIQIGLQGDPTRAEKIIEELRGILRDREVQGEAPVWTVTYSDVARDEAVSNLREALDQTGDKAWPEVLGVA